jgi:two-component system sensor histidine kinase KdpD
MNRRLAGSVVGVLASASLGAAMLPLRSHLSIASTALVLVVPVVAGVVTGGFVAGLVSVAAGFLVYDLVFIPPYYTLHVGAPQNWVALGVYVVVMVLVARVVAALGEARAASNARSANARHLFELSELLLADKPVPDLRQSIVQEVRESFGLSGATLLLSVDGRLEVVASSGTSISETELAQLRPGARVPVPLSTQTSGEAVRLLALSAYGRPQGLLVLRGAPSDAALRELLPTLANHLALALERAELHERALRAEVLEESDRLRQALVGAVSHDLRTPLATIKVASSALLDPANTFLDTDAYELHSLIDLQADRLTRLVTNLLDMTRLEAGVLEIRKVPSSALDLVAEAVAGIRPSLGKRQVEVLLPEQLPAIEVDHLLIGQVLTNLLDNADRHSPPGTPITVSGELENGGLALSVADNGPGVPEGEREAVFESFVRFDTGGRAGLGLALAKTFVEAHGGRIWVEEPPDGGARFVFTLPLAPADGAKG